MEILEEGVLGGVVERLVGVFCGEVGGGRVNPVAAALVEIERLKGRARELEKEVVRVKKEEEAGEGEVEVVSVVRVEEKGKGKGVEEGGRRRVRDR